MSTLTKIIVTSVISLMLLSCNFSMNLGPGVDGNGNVINVERSISNDFESIKISQGIDLYITQSNNIALTVEADENLMDLIMTEVVDGTLRIYSTENIRRATSKKVLLNIETISSIKGTSGSSVYSKNTLEVDKLELHTTSGTHIKVDVKTKKLECSTTSGSEIEVSGITETLYANATSGSDIDASDLQAESSDVRATSGADISVNTSKTLIAKATSGGDIRYSGNPEKIETADSSAGRVRQD
ncbi:head GIN domain-containing protein [uncultured Winogradskyella sp.]|uniref:head GIN domain-containing protein n=1 Tax=Winogradskyella sp. 4-2091 TaxID=3381659 RepID=UPI0026099938|nr:head GIN domain-containing protein [uncultured Winogradskyella sp.]